MTDQLEIYLTPGEIMWTWCRACMDRTDHVYRPGTKTPLACTKCHPELDPQQKQDVKIVQP